MVEPFRFPKWTNALVTTLGAGALAVPLYAAGMVWYGFSPITTDVGYQPDQPIPFSHQIHAGKLGIDCRYCHNTVERAAKAAIPPTQTCMNCHSGIHNVPDAAADPDGSLFRITNRKLQPLIDSYRTGLPISWPSGGQKSGEPGWSRVHDLPDYAFFDHSAHVNRGVSCVECHGRVDRMETVYQAKRLSMGWCLECHRDPGSRLRDPKDIFDLNSPTLFDDAGADAVARFLDINQINPSTDCSTCHR